MSISVIEITEQSPCLSDVITLGDEHKATLGLLPRAAFKEAAKRRHILVAVDSDSCVMGYLLYRIAKTRGVARITHLCVDTRHRGRGIARQLVQRLIVDTITLAGIDLYSKRTYESNSFWRHVGFKYVGEKLGRGRDRAVLTHFWYDHGQPSLITITNEATINSKPVKAVIDANIFISLFESDDHPLLADWFVDDVSLCVTPELSNEISRDDNAERRVKMLAYVHSFPEVSVDRNTFDSTVSLIRSHFPEQLNERDKSDIKQVGFAVASGADFLITNDQDLITRLHEAVFDDFGLSIVSDDDLILHLDELMSKAKYQPCRFAGSTIQMVHVQSHQSPSIADAFHRQTGLKKSRFRAELKQYLTRPKAYETLVAMQADGDLLALLVLKIDMPGRLEVPLFQVVDSSLSPAIDSALLYWITRQALRQKEEVVIITDVDVSRYTQQALDENSFMKFSNCWVKVNMKGIETVSGIFDRLNGLESRHLDLRDPIQCIRSAVSTGAASVDTVVTLEKTLWPVKVNESQVPTFIVPINPQWAVDLFDYDLGNYSLFGSNPALMFKMENVYYRSARTRLPTAPSRILWYVSAGRGKSQHGVMAVRACSFNDETMIGGPSELFKQSAKLGVYSWREVLKVASGESHRNVLAFRFSRTELFQHPVGLKELKRITGRQAAPMGPQRIGEREFEEIYTRGTGLEVE